MPPPNQHATADGSAAGKRAQGADRSSPAPRSPARGASLPSVVASGSPRTRHDSRTAATGKPGAPPARSPVSAGAARRSPVRSPARSPVSQPRTPQYSGPMYSTFRQFSSFGKGAELRDEMTQQQFVKLCDDTGITDQHFSRVDADLVFTSVKGHQVKIAYPEFQQALVAAARKKGVPLAEVEEKVSRHARLGIAPSTGNATSHDGCSAYVVAAPAEPVPAPIGGPVSPADRHAAHVTKADALAEELRAAPPDTSGGAAAGRAAGRTPPRRGTAVAAPPRDVIVFGEERCKGSQEVRSALRAAGVSFTVGDPDTTACDVALDGSDFPGGRLHLPVVVAGGRVWWRTADGGGNFTDAADLARQVATVAHATA